ncbi:phosphate:Na+ symporter [Neisseria sp. HSC-16F19]|nr:Na/Pi symporter [Neisseria sp. HSC-16F19]MCP2041369.1 phosphate:Na+ symporter [Neisseria sp. HSC-16F19]
MNFHPRAVPLFKPLFFLALGLGLLYSFWHSNAWLELCYGLALFLFGMQCIEEGLHNAAGGTLSRLMERSTSTPVKGMLFGLGATFVLQSSTLVSLLTIAFLSTGLITLAGGIAIIFGTNLGATSGVWLLALAGQNVSLSAAAIPMLVLGILAGFAGNRGKTFGRVLVGIALIFLGIDAVKSGFQALGGEMDMASFRVQGFWGILLFVGIGLALTMVLQSSHATLILTLAALAGGQIDVMQGFAIAVGSNVGSSLSTAIVGMLGSERSGQRLAAVHLIFNTVTALISLILWWPLTRLVTGLADWVGMGVLLQLALFHTLFNAIGLAAFWPLQKRLADKLERLMPDKAAAGLPESETEAVEPLYLNDNMLRSGDTALQAVCRETEHLRDVCLAAVARILYLPTDLLKQPELESPPAPALPLKVHAEDIYKQQIKPLYSALLDFTSKIDIEGEDEQQRLTEAHMEAWRMAEMVKEAKHLQKNLYHNLADEASPLRADYLRLRKQLYRIIRRFQAVQNATAEERAAAEQSLRNSVQALDKAHVRVLAKLRRKEIGGWQVSSLLNDLNYARRISWGLVEVLELVVALEEESAPPPVPPAPEAA